MKRLEFDPTSIFAAPAAPIEPDPAKLDGCPECTIRNNRPIYAFPEGAGSVCCYRCHNCGHSWWTAWGEER